MRVHPEGWPWIGGSLLAAALAYALGRRTTALAACLSAFGTAFFFRDPERRPPSPCQDLVLAPADGRVVTVRQEPEPLWLQTERAWRVGIFLSVFDVHINRMPLSARVVDIRHQPGRFRPAFHEETLAQNERRLYFLEDDHGQRILMVQIAGLIARRTVAWVRPGQHLVCGQRFGMIRFGSRVELFLPAHARILVAQGHRVRAGESPLAVLAAPQGP